MVEWSDIKNTIDIVRLITDQWIVIQTQRTTIKKRKPCFEFLFNRILTISRGITNDARVMYQRWVFIQFSDQV